MWSHLLSPLFEVISDHSREVLSRSSVCATVSRGTTSMCVPLMECARRRDGSLHSPAHFTTHLCTVTRQNIRCEEVWPPGATLNLELESSAVLSSGLIQMKESRQKWVKVTHISTSSDLNLPLAQNRVF